MINRAGICLPAVLHIYDVISDLPGAGEYRASTPHRQPTFSDKHVARSCQPLCNGKPIPPRNCSQACGRIDLWDARCLLQTNILIRNRCLCQFRRALRRSDQLCLMHCSRASRKHAAAIGYASHALPFEAALLAMLLENTKKSCACSN
jgi:hypothetical protein